MNRIITLNILNAMYYEKSDISFSSLIKSLPKREPGFDAIAIFSFKQKDETIDIKLENIGIHSAPPSLTPDCPEHPEDMLAINAGKYSFMQTQIIDEKNLKLEMLPFINTKKEGIVFIRIFKESLFEEVMQFIMQI